MEEERYNITHDCNGVKFVLEDFQPDPEESRILIYKLLEQAIRDYVQLYKSEFSHEKYAWITAKAFLFDDDYLLEWGSWTMCPEELLEVINIDLSWLRIQIIKQFNDKYGDNNE